MLNSQRQARRKAILRLCNDMARDGWLYCGWDRLSAKPRFCLRRYDITLRD